jgi:L-alanine-DL-glutamate epimerase-like enolase superfamily enzyme
MSIRTSLRLYAADLHYPRELQVHTAASGLVASLSARYFVIERSDGFRGIGEVRANISYLSHIPESAVDPAIIALCRRLPWGAAPEEILAATQELNAAVPHVATAAVENTLVEGLARSQDVPVAEYLGGQWSEGVETNQCLFWGPDETFELLTDRFLKEGFRQIKARIAIGAFDQDLARLAAAARTRRASRINRRRRQWRPGTRAKRSNGCACSSPSGSPMLSNRRRRVTGRLSARRSNPRTFR